MTSNILICSDGDALFQDIKQKKGRHGLIQRIGLGHWIILWVDIDCSWMKEIDERDELVLAIR